MKRGGWSVVLALYTALTVLLTWPIAARAATQVPHYTGDIWILLWDNWWFRKALFEGQALFSTPFLFYPQGAGLASHSTCFTMSLLATALRPLGGDLFAYNVAVLAIFPIGALGAYLLVVDLTGRRDAAFVAGLVYAFAPIHLIHGLGHPHLSSVQFMPYTALFLTRLLRGGRLGDAVGAGATFALTVWSGLHLASLFAQWAAAFVVWTLLRERDARRARMLAGLGVAATVAAVATLPFLLALLSEWRGLVGGADALVVMRRETGQADLLAYFVPPHLNPLVGGWVQPAYELFFANRRIPAYLGVVPLALALAAGLHRRREAFFWWASGLLWILLSLGSFLRVSGRIYPAIQLPFDLLDSRFPFNTIRYAYRYNILVPLSLAVLVGFGLTLLRRRAAVAVAGLVIVAEYLCIPIPMWPPHTIPPFVHQMREDGGRYAVVDFPIGEWCAKTWMYLQTVHEKPLVDGHVSRLPPGCYAFIDGFPLLKAVRDPRSPPPADVPADLCRLEAAGVRYLLVHPRFATAQELKRWLSWLAFPPIYRDDDLIVYATADGCRARALPGTEPRPDVAEAAEHLVGVATERGLPRRPQRKRRRASRAGAGSQPEALLVSGSFGSMKQ